MLIDKTIQMKKLYHIFLFTFIAFNFMSCENDGPTTADFITFEMDKAILVPAGETVNENIKVFGTKTVSSDITLNIEILETSTLDPASYTLPSSVTIPANSNIGNIPLEVQDMNIDPDKLLELNLTTEDETIYLGEPISINVGLKCPKLEIVFDGYASETGVEIKDASDAIVYSFPAGTYTDGTESMSVTLCALTPGDYVFTITDVFGDGLSYPEYGSYKMALAEELYFFNNEFDTASESHNFTVQP
jgi:hypothetical protein